MLCTVDYEMNVEAKEFQFYCNNLFSKKEEENASFSFCCDEKNFNTVQEEVSFGFYSIFF